MSGSKILNILVTITSVVLIVLLIILGVQVLSPQEKNSTFKENVVIGGIKGNDVEQAMELAVSMGENNEEVVLPHDYVDTNVSVKVVKLIQSYTHIVNKTVWGK